MTTRTRALSTCFAGVALAGASAALAVDLPEPTYTYCEQEIGDFRTGANNNDAFMYTEIISAPPEFADCFYITGKLQKDCVWDRQPKCCLVEFSKPLTAFDETGRNIGLVEEVLQIEDVFNGTGVMNVNILSDGTLRLGATSVFDCFDGTLNGLFSNGLHGDTGQIVVDVVFNNGPIESYTFRFEEGREAIRLAYVAPAGAVSAEVICYDNRGTKPVCYDVDFYWVQGLTERELYCITQLGGKDYDCEATNTVMGWYDKNGNQQGGPFGIASSSAGNNIPEYAELCVIADDMGSIRFAISGYGDENFNGLLDSEEVPYFEFLEDEGYLVDDNNVVKGENWIPGASTKTNPQDVIRLSREDFDEYPQYQCPPGHGVCGCYTLKVRLNLHEDEESDDDDDFGGGGLAQRADMSGDGFVDAIDLAMLLSFWGPVQ